MSVFRPAARVTDLEGREWELYAYRVVLPRREPLVGSLYEDGGTRGIGIVFGALPLALDALGRALLRLFVDIPVACAKALGSDSWTVEAISWAPFKVTLTWRTTSEFRGQVLARVEGSLARGERPDPRNAVFLGEVP